MRSVVYPIINRVLAPSQVVSRIFFPSTVNQLRFDVIRSGQGHGSHRFISQFLMLFLLKLKRRLKAEMYPKNGATRDAQFQMICPTPTFWHEFLCIRGHIRFPWVLIGYLAYMVETSSDFVCPCQMNATLHDNPSFLGSSTTSLSTI